MVIAVDPAEHRFSRACEPGETSAQLRLPFGGKEPLDRVDLPHGVLSAGREIARRRRSRPERAERLVELGRERADLGGPAVVDRGTGRGIRDEALAPLPAVLGRRDELLEQRNRILLQAVGEVHCAERRGTPRNRSPRNVTSSTSGCTPGQRRR